jgi:hypothetical protein
MPEMSEPTTPCHSERSEESRPSRISLESNMKVKVTEQGVLIPKHLLKSVDEVEIRELDGMLLVIPVADEDPIFHLGKDPIEDDITDASANHDRYLYHLMG